MKKHRISGGFEPTPNPCSYRLSIEESGFPAGSAFDFTSSVSEAESPLAQVLFRHFPLERVFISDHFITLTHLPEEDFSSFSSSLLRFITHYFAASGQILGKAIEKKQREGREKKKVRSTEGGTVAETIQQILSEYVAPAIARDGGAIHLHSYSEGKVLLHLQGACKGCPSAALTLKAGIEELLKSMVPEVQSVEAVEEEGEAL